MVRYLNPGGHNWGAENLDGYGISYIIVAVVYSVFFYAACAYVWWHRHHPVIRMRKINLALLSLLILHVYLFMIFMVYPINGAFPCGVEFWTMSIYLPIGIGLYQAQNQQLLIVSREQNHLVRNEEFFKPMFAGRGKGIGGPRYLMFRFKVWWNSASKQGKYEGFVFAGMVVQFVISMIIYCISRKFNGYGVVSQSTTPGLCRRGWEWAPSIVWQLLWNYFFGPYLLWKIRMIHDIYHWRLQTFLAVVAGIPGTPLWLAGVYTDSFASINKYWVPAMWFVPGLVTMELTTLIFPIIQIQKHRQNARETTRVLEEFDRKRLNTSDGSTTSESIVTGSTGSKRGKMYSMESLDECLHTSYDGLQVYASCMELNGENIIFLVKVLTFHKTWALTFSRTKDSLRSRTTMFRAALSIYISLVHSSTAAYPINIESPIYAHLESIFGHATALVASSKRNSNASPSPISHVTPWDEPADPLDATTPPPSDFGPNALPMKSMLSSTTTRHSTSNDSSEYIISLDDPTPDPLADLPIPHAFDELVFDAAFKSVKYMVWTETWQRYMVWKRFAKPPAV